MAGSLYISLYNHHAYMILCPLVAAFLKSNWLLLKYNLIVLPLQCNYNFIIWSIIVVDYRYSIVKVWDYSPHPLLCRLHTLIPQSLAQLMLESISNETLFQLGK